MNRSVLDVCPTERHPSDKGITVLLRAQMLLLVFGSFCSFSQGYVKISAEIHIVERTWARGHSSSAPSTNQWTVPFVCTVGTNEWQLDGGFVRYAREKWHYDGKDVYE